MMRKRFPLTLIGISSLTSLLFACAPEPEDPGADPGGTVSLVEALMANNALSPNGLNPNGISPNGLSPNGLSPSGLSLLALSPAALSALQDPSPIGDLSRMFLRYAVGCAFDQDQAFDVSWTDTRGARHDETYRGHLGLAPAWAQGPLNLAGQQRVSACLGALTNYSGTSVLVSLRSLEEPLKTLTGSPELKQYRYVEGAFFGNLFAATPLLYACYDDANVAHSRQAYRECAAGHVTPAALPDPDPPESCGLIQLLGSCRHHCQKLNGAGQYYPSCTDPVTHSPTKSVMTTALP